MKLGAQLYTIRKFCATPEDFSESLKKVADIGYTTVQVSGTCAYEPEWLKEELDKNGLSCVLTHTKGAAMVADPVKVCRDHDIFGCRHIGLGALSMAQKELGITEDDYATFLKDFTPVAKAFYENGHKLFYHNHHFEFAKSENGKLYLERLMEDFSPDLLGITFDTYWAQFGGADPAEWLSKLKGRVECIHLKDLAIVGREQRMAAVGEGNINFDAILKVAENVGVNYLLVEQDDCYGEDPFSCLKRSYDYLVSLGLS